MEVRRRYGLIPLWLFVSLLIVAVDYVTGPYLQFPVLYLVPVALASWYSGLAWGMVFAVLLPPLREFLITLWEVPWTAFEACINAVTDAAVLSVFSVLIVRVAADERRLSAEVQVLKGLLPICSFCKKIRGQNEQWEKLEVYISQHSEAEFSHGMCPDCAKAHYPDIFNKSKASK